MGAVALYMASGKSPDQFPQRGLRVDVEAGGISVGADLLETITGLLEPSPGEGSWHMTSRLRSYSGEAEVRFIHTEHTRDTLEDELSPRQAR